MTTYVVGMRASWLSVWGQLLASGVLLLSGLPDLRLKARMGAAFSFFMALALAMSALVTAIRSNLSYAAVICAVILCFETLFILHRVLNKKSQ
jgi:hypothetical protein